MEPQEWYQSENDWTGKRGNSRCEVEKACEWRRSWWFGNYQQNPGNRGARAGNRRDVDSLSKFAVGAKNSKRGTFGREVVGGKSGYTVKMSLIPREGCSRSRFLEHGQRLEYRKGQTFGDRQDCTGSKEPNNLATSLSDITLNGKVTS